MKEICQVCDKEVHSVYTCFASGHKSCVNLNSLRTENKNLKYRLAKIDTPMIENFIDSVKNEMEHQKLRWNDDHKSSNDWFWLVGYLAGKALSAPNIEKKKHHIITTCAALGNWFEFEINSSNNTNNKGK